MYEELCSRMDKRKQTFEGNLSNMESRLKEKTLT